MIAGVVHQAFYEIRLGKRILDSDWMNLCEYCGAEMKTSKRGNDYCSNICWEKEPYKTQRYLDRIAWEAMIESEHGDWGNRQ